MKFLFALLFLSATILLNAQEAKYGIKSAIIKKDVVAMGQKVECTWYMDDYGKKESTELTMKTGGVAGVEKHIRTGWEFSDQYRSGYENGHENEITRKTDQLFAVNS